MAQFIRLDNFALMCFRKCMVCKSKQKKECHSGDKIDPRMEACLDCGKEMLTEMLEDTILTDKNGIKYVEVQIDSGEDIKKVNISVKSIERKLEQVAAFRKAYS